MTLITTATTTATTVATAVVTITRVAKRPGYATAAVCGSGPAGRGLLHRPDGNERYDKNRNDPEKDVPELRRHRFQRYPSPQMLQQRLEQPE